MADQDPEKNGKTLRIIISIIFVSIIVLVGIYVIFFMQGGILGDEIPVIATEYENITADKAYEIFSKYNSSMAENNLIIIDARVLYKSCPSCLDSLYRVGHIPGAILDKTLDSEAYYQDLNQSADILVYNQEDSSKTESFCNHLVGHVYGNIYNLEGGYNAWKNAGYPIETGD